jgi:hypothetical protein
MTVRELIEELNKIEDKSRLVVVNDKVSDEYVIATQVVEQDSLGVNNYDEEIMDVDEVEIDCVVIE